MKTKEIIESAQVADGVNRRNQSKLLKLFKDELLQSYASFNGQDSERLFEASVKQVRGKWDAISRKIRKGLSLELWNYFYATQVKPMKHELCPTWSKKQDEYKRRQIERYNRGRKETPYDATMYDDYINEMKYDNN